MIATGGLSVCRVFSTRMTRSVRAVKLRAVSFLVELRRLSVHASITRGTGRPERPTPGTKRIRTVNRRLKGAVCRQDQRPTGTVADRLGYVNPLKGSGVRWLHFEVLSAIQV